MPGSKWHLDGGAGVKLMDGFIDLREWVLKNSQDAPDETREDRWKH